MCQAHPDVLGASSHAKQLYFGHLSGGLALESVRERDIMGLPSRR